MFEGLKGQSKGKKNQKQNKLNYTNSMMTNKEQ